MSVHVVGFNAKQHGSHSDGTKKDPCGGTWLHFSRPKGHPDRRIMTVCSVCGEQISPTVKQMFRKDGNVFRRAELVGWIYEP